LDKN
jgi:hypothetical protein